MASSKKPEEGAHGEYDDDDEHDDGGNESYYSEQSERNGDDRSFYSQDSRTDDRSNHHGSYRSKEGSFVSGEGSVRSDGGSRRSGEGSYRSGEGSYRSRGRSYRSGEGSYRSGDGSYRSGDGSYRSRGSGEGSYRSGERSYRSGEGSYRSGDGSYRSGEGSYHSKERSYRSGEGSHRSGEGSYRSGEGSYRSKERSYRSGEGSYRSGEGSYRSGDGSYRSKERSYRSGEGSYRSGEGSYRSGDGSYRSRERSYRSGEGSYRSGEGSYRSGDGSYRSRERSYHSGEGSYRSGEGSYRSREGSHNLKDEDRSLRSDEQSKRNGEESFRSASVTEKNGDSVTKSFAEEDGQSSFHSDSNRSGDSRRSSSSEKVERFNIADQSGPTSSPRGANRQDNGHAGDDKSFHSDEHSNYEDEGPHNDEGDGSDYSDDDEDVASFGEEVIEEPVIRPKSPSRSQSGGRSFQDSRYSMGTNSEMDSVAPSFAEESVFSPYTKSPKNVVNASTDVFGNGDFADVDFGKHPVTDDEDEEGQSAFPSTGFSGDMEAAFDDFGSNAFGGDTFSSMEKENGFGTDADAFSSAFDTNVFGSTDIGTADFAPSTFGATEEFSAFQTDFNEKMAFDSDDKTDSANYLESNEDSSRGSEGKLPAGESTNSFSQQPGDGTEPESGKSDTFATKSTSQDDFGNAFGSSSVDEPDLAFGEGTFDQRTNNSSGLHDELLPDHSFNGSIGSSVPPPEVEEGASLDGNSSAFQKSDAWDAVGGADADVSPGKETNEESGSSRHESQDSRHSGTLSENRSFHSEERSHSMSESQSGTKSFHSGDVVDESFGSRDHYDKNPVQSDSSYHSGNRSSSEELPQENHSRGSSRSRGQSDTKSFQSGDESQGSFSRGDENDSKPYQSEDESRRSYRSGDNAEEQSFHGDGGSQGSYRSGDQYESKSFHSTDEDRSESAKSFHSGDDSRNSIPNGSNALERSFHSEQGSNGSYDSSQQSGDRSLHPEDESHGSYRSNEGQGTESFQSGDVSAKSDPKKDQPEHESYQSEEKSFHSEEESRNSYRSGSLSNTKSFHSEDESRASLKGAEESDAKSFYSGDASGKSFQSGDQSNAQSFSSQDGSHEFNGSAEQLAHLSTNESQNKITSPSQSDEQTFDAEGSMMSSVQGNGSRVADEKLSSSAGQSQSQEMEGNQSLDESFQSETNSRNLEADPTLDDRSAQEGEESVQMSEGSYRSGDDLQQSIDEEQSNYESQSSSGSSFAHDGSDVPENETDINSGHRQSEPQGQRNENDPSVSEDEASIGIGDVFGKPKEFFEDQPKSTPKTMPGKSDKEDSYKSEATQDDTVDDRSKMSPREVDAAKSITEHQPIGTSPAQAGPVQSTGTPSSRPRNQEREAKKTVSKPRQKEDPEERKKRKKRKKKVQREAKSRALLDLVANVNDAMLDLEERDAQASEEKENNMDTSAHRLLHGFDALLGIYLQLSDELELIATFAKAKKKKDRDAMPSVQALKAVLSFAATLDELFADLKPIILDCFDEEPDEEMDDMLYRLNSLVDLLYETTHRVGERQEWNERAETTYVTLLELMDREATELISYYEDVETPEQVLSANIHEAWSATGHIEELRALQYASDPWLFRQLCYEVMVSTDQWCPDTTILMEICGIDPSMLEEEPDDEYLEEDELPLIPQAAEHVLDKVNGDPLPRTATLASILRRILPPRAVTDVTLLDHFTSIRNTLRNPLGLSATNIVSISSVPEQPSDPDSLGVGGIGKSTLAAMVARHPDVRRYFIDGVVWVYVGDKELNYNRYTQCLRELVAQLDFYQGVPLFAELLHVPGETLSKRRRREEGFMIYARDTIAELLHDKSVLIILDDVCFEPDLDWFDFAPMPGEETDDFDSNCALLVTTRCRTLLPAADTVEVDMLDEADAISLLIQESGQLSHTLMAESREARSVVRECANHPLAVKSVGRWLNLKHATAGVVSSVEEIHSEVIKSMDKILKGGDHTGTDMMYEILSMSLSPAINGEPTSIIKFCLAAFIIVFCDRQYISDFALTEPSPIIPMDMAELLFETLLEMNESSLLQKGSLFYAQKKEAAVLIPEALSALGVLKVITYSDAEDEENPDDEQKFLQVMHFIHHEYGEYLSNEEEALKELTKDAERQWNRALVEAYLSQVEAWDMDLEDAGHSYALEMIISHMIRGGMYSAAADLLADKSFVRGRLLSLGRENSTRRHIKDCEMLFKKLRERRPKGSKLEPRTVMKQAYQALGSQLAFEDEEQSIEDARIKDVEVARAHYEIGFSLAEKRCWDAAIAHWETSQELLVAALGTVEIVAGILFNIGVVYSEMNEYEQALDSLKQCLRIRGTIHGEDHILYAQTIQKIGDVFLGMSDYHEATESYNWALDVMYLDPNIHRVEIGEILDNKGTIHYSKGEIDEALQCHQEALRSKQVELGEDHPELSGTYHHIGNCLSDQGNVDDAIVHFEEAIRLKELDPEGGPERDADVLTIEGILHNLEGNQEQGLECYEKSLQILVTKVPHRKEKVASLLHLIGCVYLMSGEQKKAMKLFEESLQARRKVLGFVHLDVASTLFNMAFLHQTRNRLDRALKCLEEALKIRQLRLPDSEKVAVTHEKIGSLARAIGKTKKAQINFEDALRIRRLLHGEQHEAVATVLQELGDLMDDLGEYDSAMSYYIDALDIRRNRLGLDDIAVAETLYSMGYTLHNNDEPDRALVCFEESLNIRRYQLGEDSKEVGDTLNMMGFLKAKRSELDDALTLLWDALRIRKLQEDHVKVSETLKNIGNVHREKKELDLAVECYEECLRIRRSELGPDHEKVADALIAMGNVQSDMERNDEAMRSYQEALKIRTLVFGEHDESVAAVLQYMGTMEFRANNHDKARDLLTEFIRIRRDNDTKNDGDYVNVLFMIGNIHKMQTREDEAQACWSEAYQVFQELGLAETNPQIAKVMSHLLNLDEQKEDAEQKKKGKGGSMFGKVTEKLKGNLKEEKSAKKKARKGKGIQL